MTSPARQTANDARPWARVLPPLIILAAGAIAYAGSFAGVFLFDDYGRIVENERIRQLFPPGPWLGTRRPIVELTFAVNYAVGGLKPWGYHFVNLLIHLAAGLTIFGVIRRTATIVRGTANQGSSTWSACVASLLWVVHPLTTQSVTYVIQRGESLMGLLYLWCVYTLLRGAQSARPARWYAVTVAACAAGMGTKAVMVTAPVVLLCFDRMFLASCWRDLFRRRTGLYVGLFLTWGVLVVCGVIQGVFQTAPKENANVGFAYHGITPFEYALTQPGVILQYLKLTVWPDALCLDYQWSPATSWPDVLGPALIVVSLLMATVGAILTRHWLGFAGVWFFGILAPTSSFIPIKDVIFEHRMYLPLAALTTAIVFGVQCTLRYMVPRARQRWFAGLVLAIAVASPLAWRTWERNRDYHSSLDMWQSVVDARPMSDRAHFGLGVAYYREGQLDKAQTCIEHAIELTPRYADAHFNLGVIHTAKREWPEALASYRTAVEVAPLRDQYAQALVDLLIYLQRFDEAERVVRQTLTNVPHAEWARQRLVELRSRVQP